MRDKIKALMISILLISVTAVSFGYTVNSATLTTTNNVSGNTYYVSNTGNDNNAGTISNPWRTIQKAMNTASAGDTVLVAAGNYGESLSWSRSGTSSAYITIKAQNPVTPGPSTYSQMPQTGKIVMTGSYLILDGLAQTTTSNEAGINMRGGHHQVVKNCYTKNTAWSGIRADQGAHDIIITHNYLDSPINTAGNQEALSLEGAQGGIYNFEISYNTVYSTKKEGIDCKVGCHDGVICYNDVYSQAPDIYLDSYGHLQYNIDVYGNYCHGEGAGFVLGFEQSGGGNKDMNIYNNIFKSRAWGITEIFESNPGYTADNIKIMNNIFDGCSGGIRFHSTQSDYTNIIVANNILDVGTNYYINSGHDVSFYNNMESGDPKWVDPSSVPDGYHLQSSSPCINAGSSTNSPLLDFDGNARVGAVDIGAFEYGGTNTYNTVGSITTGTESETLPTGSYATETATITTNPTTQQTTNPTTQQSSDEGSTYYVSNSGSDSNSGTSTNSPWRTISHAINAVSAGATVYVMAGTYSENPRFSKSGTSSNWITFKSYTLNTAIINGRVDIRGHYIVFDGFKIQTSSGGAVHIQGGASYVKFQNNYITQTSTDDSMVVQLEGNSGALSHIEVLNNKVMAGKKGIDCTNALSNSIIAGNEVTTTEAGIAFDPYTTGSMNNNKVYNNYVHGSFSICAMWIGNPSSGGNLDGLDVYNNIIVNTGNWGISAGTCTSCTFKNVRIINNVFVAGNTVMHLIGETQTSWTIRNNIMKANNMFNVKSGSTITADHNCYSTSTGQLGSNNQIGDPGMDSTYHLTSGSICINTGSSINAPATDYDGGTRVGNVDIGAFEYGSTQSTSVNTIETPQEITNPTTQETTNPTTQQTTTTHHTTHPTIQETTNPTTQQTTTTQETTNPTTQQTTNTTTQETTIPTGTTEYETYIDTTNYKNNPPNTPRGRSGEINAKKGQDCLYTTITTDPDGDQLYYNWSWGDGTYTGWIGPYPSGLEASFTHKWLEKGTYTIKVKVMDTNGAESDWETFKVSIYSTSQQILKKIIDRFPILEKLLNLIL